MLRARPTSARVNILDLNALTRGQGPEGPEGDDDVLGTHFSAATSSLNTHSLGTGSTGDDNGTALHGEHVHEGIGFGHFDHLGGWGLVCAFICLERRCCPERQGISG